jgi:aspartyl-tRNA(Asn)/glutamyl-tRNA(Gln) amidotransferase subunit A
MTRGVEGLTVAVAERFFMEHTAPDIAVRVRDAVDVLSAAGAQVTEIDLEWPVDGTVDGEGFYLAEEAAALARLWPVERARLGPDVVAALEAADRMNGVAAARVGLLKLEYAGRMLEKAADARVDLIATPTQAFTPPPLGTRRVPFADHESVDVTAAMCALTGVFNVLGWPAITVPHGTDGAGMPVGVQIAALPWREADCLAAAAVIESRGEQAPAVGPPQGHA